MTTHALGANDTLSESSTQDVSVLVTAALLAVLVVVFIFGTVANSLVFLVFYRRPSLRSLSNRFVLSLTSANLVSTVVVVPVHALRLWGLTPLLTPSTATGADGDHDVGRGGEEFWWCQVSKALMALAVEAAIFSVLLIAVDRYCAVTSPLHYSMTITRGRSVRLIVGVWTLALLYALPQLLAHTYAHLRPASRLSACPSGQDVVSAVPIKFGLYYAVLLSLCGFLVPLFVLCWIYVHMYRAAQRNSARTRRHSLGHNPAEIIIPDCPSVAESGSTNNSVRCKTRVHRRRSSNTSFSSLFFREEGRAVKTAVIVIASFVTSWMPYFIYKICEAGGWTKDIPYLNELVICVALSSSCTSPFIYVYRNETASKEVLKIICWWRPPSPATPSFSRSSLNPKMGNGHAPTPVRIIEPDTASLYSYATECGACGHNQLVCSLRNGRPVTSPLPSDQRRASNPRRESTVSFKLTPMDRPSSRCRQCLRQDSASSASSDDPLLSECFRHHRASNPSVRWTRPRMSNGSVTTRSDSLVSTNSSVLSGGIQRWPMRRYSTVSTDSGGTITRRSAHEDGEEDMPMGRLSVPGGGQRSLFLESEEDGYETSSGQPSMHGYANPFRHPHISQRQESGSSSVRFIWEIEEGDGQDDETTEPEQRDLPVR
ncbi:beta-3 adrenergic receptor-like [Portunus trituberculatus]|uniref:beta-3 adrenergic receptor-like n=1 Tax=Portunus trituberculatus TaxID=210409 RepID=UPI001E1CC6A8|nr:beta-3 adrenergic receptor-like [Portunus trituberculatus]